jgi:copper chaperone NosL
LLADVLPLAGVFPLAVLLLPAGLALGCGGGPVRPAAIDRANDQCSSCRMIVSDARFAAQVAAPGEEPRFFDDLRCLRDGLRSGPPLARGAVIFVTDFRTGAWVPAASAVFARLPAVDTPMASHWVAWADEASRRADPGGAQAETVPAEEILGTGGDTRRAPAGARP